MLPEDERNEVYNEVKQVMKELSILQSDNCCDPPPAKKCRFSSLEDGERDGDFEVEDEFQLYMKTANYSDYLHNDDTKKSLIMALR